MQARVRSLRQPAYRRPTRTASVLVLNRNGELLILDDKGREIDRFKVPVGAVLSRRRRREGQGATSSAEWDPHTHPDPRRGSAARSASRTSSRARPSRCEAEIDQAPAAARRMVIEHKGDLHPQMVIEDADGKILDFHYDPREGVPRVDDGQEDQGGPMLASPRPRARAPAGGHHRRSAAGDRDLRGP